MKTRYYLSLIGFLSVFNLYSQSLEDYIAKGLRRHPALIAADAHYEGEAARVSIASYWKEPRLGVGYYPSPIATRLGEQRAYIALSQRFEWPGTIRALKRQYQHKATSASHEIQAQKERIRLNIKTTYYALFEAHKHIEIQKKHLSLLESYAQLRTKALSSEAYPLSDVLVLDNRIEKIKSELKLMNRHRMLLIRAFNREIGESPTAEILIPDSLTLAPRMGDLKVGASPRLKVLSAALSSAEFAEDKAALASYPTFEGQLMHGFVSQRQNLDLTQNGRDIWRLQLNISLPTAQRRYQAEKRSAEAQKTHIEAQKKDLENQLLTEYEKAQFQEESARTYMRLYQYQIKKTTRILAMLHTVYQSDAQDPKQILEQEKQLLAYQRAWISSLCQGLVAQAKQYALQPPNHP